MWWALEHLQLRWICVVDRVLYCAATRCLSRICMPFSDLSVTRMLSTGSYSLCGTQSTRVWSLMPGGRPSTAGSISKCRSRRESNACSWYMANFSAVGRSKWMSSRELAVAVNAYRCSVWGQRWMARSWRPRCRCSCWPSRSVPAEIHRARRSTVRCSP